MAGLGLALSTGGRSADAVVLGVQNASGEWVAIAAATPLSPPKYLNKSTRMDLEFLAISEPQKRGEWEIELPLGSFGELRSGVLRAWAMDFSPARFVSASGRSEIFCDVTSLLRIRLRSQRAPASLDLCAMRAKISVVVPFFNEEENVAQLLVEIRAVGDALGQPYEAIFVNDGSKAPRGCGLMKR